ncbi:MAG TPA: hypothetical protein VH761_07890, partial [Ilumatobacteraceae bacterium]
MRWVRAGVVVLTLLGSVVTESGGAGAAPMTGVTFIPPIRPFDQFNIPPGTSTVPLGPPPNGAPRALVQISALPTGSSTGVIMSHECSATPDPLSDVVLPITGVSTVTTQSFVPAAGGNTCLTTTAPLTRLTVDLLAWVGPLGGAAYVDLPFNYVATIQGPVTGVPVDMTPYGVPPDSTGVAVWLDVVPETDGFAALTACGGPPPSVAQAVWTAHVPSTAVVSGVPISQTGLCVTIGGAATVDISVDGYYRPGATPTPTSPPEVRYLELPAPRFTGIAPVRVFDTRKNGSPVSTGSDRRLDLSSFVASDTTAVVMNVTVTEPLGSGFVTAHPCDEPVPETSSLNFVAGQTVPNLVTVAVGVNLDVCFFASSTTHILADLAGYYSFAAGDGYTPAAPTRMFDTRGGPKLFGHFTFEFDMSPYVAADASSAVFNLTSTEVEQPGYVTAYPCGLWPPEASNLNVFPGQTTPNLVTVKLPLNKHVCFYTTSRLHLLADLAGWYSPSSASGLIPITPTRWIDTRDESPIPIPADSVLGIDFGLDFPDATAVVFNATVTDTRQPGYLTAFPCGDGTPPDASNVNFVAGQTVPNMVIAAV